MPEVGGSCATAPSWAEEWITAILGADAVLLGRADGATCWTGTLGDTAVCLLLERGPHDGPMPDSEPVPATSAFADGSAPSAAVTARAVDFAARTGSALVTILLNGGLPLGSERGSHLRALHRLSGSVPHLSVEAGDRTPLGRLRAEAADFRIAVTHEHEHDAPHVSEKVHAAAWVRTLVPLLPANAALPAPRGDGAVEESPLDDSADPVRVVEDLSDVPPVLVGPVTGGIQTGFAVLRGNTVGYAASTAFTANGAVDPGDVRSVVRLLDFCDAFHLPCLVVLDTPSRQDDSDSLPLNSLVRSLSESATALAVLVTGRCADDVGQLLTDRALVTGDVLAWPRASAADGARFDRVIEPSRTADELLATLSRWSTVDEPLPVRRRGVSPR